MLEKMCEFFENRIDEYDEHMLTIECANEFYEFTAQCLPMQSCHILDLGCGTGIELEYYFKRNPCANVTGIDLSKKMLDVCKSKFHDKNLCLIVGSYFDIEFNHNYDAIVSVESLHHYTKDEKILLYSKLWKTLKKDGYFILTDYFSLSDDEEMMHQNNLMQLKEEQNIIDFEVYHYDIPLTIQHEIEALLEAGFSSVEVLNQWGATFTLKANN